MEHYFYFGLAAVVLLLLLLTIGPRHKHRSNLSSTFSGKGFHGEKNDAERG